MSHLTEGASGARGACASCTRRSWLLSELSVPLEYCARDRGRLLGALALEDTELIEALGGRRRAELHDRRTSFETSAVNRAADVEALCHHDRRFPRALRGVRWAPRMLNTLGGPERLAAQCSAPSVAILGSRRPSDYGREMARSLARHLTASGVSVIAGWWDGIAIAAHEGAMAAGGGSLTLRGGDPELDDASGCGPVAVMGGGLGIAGAVRHRPLLSRLVSVGSAISELPCDCGGRRWGQLASERTVVALGSVALVVEAEATRGDLFAAELARALGRTVAAIPGRVTSPLSQGTNALLKDRARLVRGAEDVLELLFEIEPSQLDPSRTPTRARGPLADAELEPRLQILLERVGAGSDTPDSLIGEGIGLDEALAGVSTLELLGFLCRGDGGRYILTEPPRSTTHMAHEVVTKAASNVSAV